MIDRPAMRLRLVLILLGCGALYLIGNGSVPLWDRDEPWYAQCSLKMLRDGDWVVPRYIDGSLRTEKPPFVYWGQIAAMKIFGEGDFAVRTVPAAGMLLTLTLIGVVLWRAIGPRRALWTVFILGTGGLAIAAAKMCLTDAVLLAWISLSLFCVYAIYVGRAGWGTAALLGVAIGLGGLTKGPIMLVAPATTTIVLLIFEWRSALAGLRRLPLLKVLGGAVLILALVAAIAGPWLYLVHQREPRWLPATFAIAKSHVSSSMEGHKGPPGYYLATIWVTFFPWSLLLPTAVAVAWRNRRLPATRFAAATVLGVWIVQEIMKTKLPHYVLPAFPALAFLTADAVVRCARGQYRDLVKPIFVGVVAAWAVVVALAGSLPWLAALKFDRLPMGVMVLLSVVGVLYAAAVLGMFRARRPALAAATMGVGMMIVIALLYGLLLPRLEFLRASQYAASLLRQHGATQVGDTVFVDYKEPSLEYYHGLGTLRDAENARYPLVAPAERWPRWMVFTSELWKQLPPETQARLDVAGRYPCFGYAGDVDAADGSSTRVFDVMVVRKK